MSSSLLNNRQLDFAMLVDNYCRSCVKWLACMNDDDAEQWHMVVVLMPVQLERYSIDCTDC